MADALVSVDENYMFRPPLEARLAEKIKTYADSEDSKDRQRIGALESSVLVYGNGYIRPPAAHSPDANTLGLWSFNGSLADASGYGRTLVQYSTLQGSYSSTARFGSHSLGGGVYQSIGADRGLSSTGADGGSLLSGTVECWVKTTPHTIQKVALSHRNWYWVGVTATGRAIARYGAAGAETEMVGTSVIAGDTLATAPWNHISLVFHAGGARLLVNGKLEASSSTVGVTGVEADGGLVVGGLRADRRYDWSLSPALIDEVRVSSIPRYAAASAYPERPAGLRPGSALFIGPVLPAQRQPFDQWIRTETE